MFFLSFQPETIQKSQAFSMEIKHVIHGLIISFGIHNFFLCFLPGFILTTISDLPKTLLAHLKFFQLKVQDALLLYISDDDYRPSCVEAIRAYNVTKQSKIQELSFACFQLSLNSFPTNDVGIY
jgi:hypothetical protein